MEVEDSSSTEGSLLLHFTFEKSTQFQFSVSFILFMRIMFETLTLKHLLIHYQVLTRSSESLKSTRQITIFKILNFSGHVIRNLQYLSLRHHILRRFARL